MSEKIISLLRRQSEERPVVLPKEVLEQTLKGADDYEFVIVMGVTKSGYTAFDHSDMTNQEFTWIHAALGRIVDQVVDDTMNGYEVDKTLPTG